MKSILIAFFNAIQKTNLTTACRLYEFGNHQTDRYRCKNCVALAMMVKPNMNSSFISSELCSVFGYGTCLGNGVYMALPSSSPLLSGLLLRCCAPAAPLAASAWDPA